MLGKESKSGEERRNISQLARLSIYSCEVFVVCCATCRWKVWEEISRKRGADGIAVLSS